MYHHVYQSQNKKCNPEEKRENRGKAEHKKEQQSKIRIIPTTSSIFLLSNLYRNHKKAFNLKRTSSSPLYPLCLHSNRPINISPKSKPALLLSDLHNTASQVQWPGTSTKPLQIETPPSEDPSSLLFPIPSHPTVQTQNQFKTTKTDSPLLLLDNLSFFRISTVPSHRHSNSKHCESTAAENRKTPSHESPEPRKSLTT